MLVGMFVTLFNTFHHTPSKTSPQHIHLGLGKLSIFLSCNITYVASSHVCVFDRCFEKKKKKRQMLYFPQHTSFLQPKAVEHCTIQACIQWRKSLYLTMMIQQKYETSRVFTKYAYLA